MLAQRGSSLIVCVDCGTAAGEALAAVAGVADVVVLDHHKAEGPPPAVLATVNPNRLDDSSGLNALCAAAVAFTAASRSGAITGSISSGSITSRAAIRTVTPA